MSRMIKPIVTMSGAVASHGERDLKRKTVTPKIIGGIMRTLRRAAPSWNAPIVTLVAAHTRDPFQTLISCILSLRTKDQTTAVATRRLFEHASTPDAIMTLPIGRIEKLIFPVGFYRTKARVIRGICVDLKEKFGGEVPTISMRC